VGVNLSPFGNSYNLLEIWSFHINAKAMGTSSTPEKPFYSLYSHGFVRLAVCIPEVRVADPDFNSRRIAVLCGKASEAGAAVALFPELGISAYSNEDLFHQDALLEASKKALQRLLGESEKWTCVVLAGVPLRSEGKLFNCAAVIYGGRLLGVVPKTYLPNYREFYEKRQFTSARYAVNSEIRLFGEDVPFGNDLIFADRQIEGFKLHVEICEDVWTPIPPSTYASLAGATVLANLSASNITIGKAEYRRSLCASQSAKCIAAYMYSAAGPGESTTDLAWDGHALIHENGELLAESHRFASEEQMITGDVDLERLVQERMRCNSFTDAAADCMERLKSLRQIPFEFKIPANIPLKREVPRFPYVPSDRAARDQRCFEAYNIQVHGLMKRLSSTSIKKVVIGVSGGLDSTQALIAAAKTMDRLNLPRQNILAYTMPGFATSDQTLKNAQRLMSSLHVSNELIDIKPACMQMFRDIKHPFAEGKKVFDVTFENVQAGERTSHLFRLANFHNGLVLGTGDLSEIALGWATYGVGDHMSHYNVNVSVPKTLIQYLIRWVAASGELDTATAQVLAAIVETEISPELVPHAHGSNDVPAQKTADFIGPYELQDFTLYYISRYGLRPSKVAYLAACAWSNLEEGNWPDLIPADKRVAYDLPTIKKWLKVFLYRFFKTSQFKRSAIPNGPKVGSGGSLSPRGDWRAPSDSEADVWLQELDANVPG
jgi:NAD+ synthase (glutamine-hydrolysing)